MLALTIAIRINGNTSGIPNGNETVNLTVANLLWTVTATVNDITGEMTVEITAKGGY